MGNVCSITECENERRPGQHYCRSCHAAYMREQRAKGKYKRKPAENEQQKQRARNIANRAVAAGEIEQPENCEHCGEPGNGNLEKHHPDYSKPLEIVWVHQRCHAEIHKNDEKMAKTG